MTTSKPSRCSIRNRPVVMKLNSQQEQLHGRRISIAAFLKTIVDHMPGELNAQDRVEISVSPDVQDFHVNPNAFKIILSNIIENALIYSPNNTPVRVEIETDTL